jgi:hypothetical protein
VSLRRPTASLRGIRYGARMRTLIGIAIGAAVAGALGYLALKRRDEHEPEQVADTNLVHSGDPQEEQLAPQPQDWRGAQNVLGS